MAYLEFVTNNLYLYLAIIIALLIVDIILSIVCINQRKRKNIKDEFIEIEKEIEQEDIVDDIKPEVAFELEQILNQMQQDIETKPEEVVRKFEEEQEQKAIISYQELVDSVNNNKIDVVDDEEGTIDFVAALEMENKNNNSVDYLEKVEDISSSATLNSIDDNNLDSVSPITNKSHLDVIDEMDYDDVPKKFKSSEILSPVFGRMQPDFEYRKIDSFANTNNKVEIEQVAGESVETDLKNNEDFLKALIEFRNNL